MNTHDIALAMLTAIALGFLSYAAYLSHQIKILDARRDRREADRRKAAPSPAE